MVSTLISSKPIPSTPTSATTAKVNADNLILVQTILKQIINQYKSGIKALLVLIKAEQNVQSIIDKAFKN